MPNPFAGPVTVTTGPPLFVEWTARCLRNHPDATWTANSSTGIPYINCPRCLETP